MTLKRILQCKCLQGPFPLEIQSETDPSKTYIILVDPFANRSEAHRCSCPSFQYKKRCKHQRTAHMAICRWTELEDKGELTSSHREAKICPRCLGPAIIGVWDVSETTPDWESV